MPGHPFNARALTQPLLAGLVRARQALKGALAVACLAALPAWAAPPGLPSASIDLRQVTVSGLSAGAFMAVQLHVAHSDLFSGAAAVAGGPFLCAEGSLLAATTRCMRTLQAVPVARLVQHTRELARLGQVAPVAGLANARVFLFSGARDRTVAPEVVQALAAYYAEFVGPGNLVLRTHPQAGHGMVTQGQGGECGATAAPYLNDCAQDLAGELLSHLYPGLSAPRGPAPDENLLSFDQSAFAGGAGLAETGWLYLPTSCRPGQGAPCRLHVALHGCRQSAGEVGQRFVRDAGYNRWAERNAIVVLYPQAGKVPNACWDWWGYEGPAYATRQGKQVQAIRRMVDRLAAADGRR